MSDPPCRVGTMTRRERAERLAGLMGVVEAELDELFEEELHAKRVASLAGATVGALTHGRLGVHAIGIGLAEARGLRQKHTIKQVDRLLSNAAIEVWNLLDVWVPYVLAERTEALVALDWTDFDDDDQSTIAAYLVSSHGRATPLVWKTVRKSELKGKRGARGRRALAAARDHAAASEGDDPRRPRLCRPQAVCAARRVASGLHHPD